LYFPASDPARPKSVVQRHARCWLVLGLILASACPGLPQAGPADSLDQQTIVQFLNQTVSWYQRMAVERQVATTPGDFLFATDDRPVADQVVRLSFDFARAAAQLLEKSSGPAPQTSGDSRYQKLSQTVAKLDDQSSQTRAELDGLRQKLEKAPPRERKALESAIAEVQSELALMQARRNVTRSLLQFIGGTAEPGTLASQIEALERSVPSVLTGDTQASSTPASTTASSTQSAAADRAYQPSGIWGILRELFGLSQKLDAIKENVRQTAELKQALKQVQAPLINRLKDMVRQGDSIVNQPDSHDPAVLAQQKATLDALTGQYTTLSSALLPLGKESVLLDVYAKNLANWQGAVRSQYTANIKSLLVRLLGLAVLIGIVLGVFELWRRAIYRYIQESRRRYQFLLLRRIALWFVIALIIAFGLVSELGSLATFAGLMTAGVAVALQNVILAVVGYFLLIGKYGVRVGDRVQVSGVSGEVVEIGLIRLHVMELVGTGADAQPTGRIVAFSNSIVFQPTAGLFKQAPGMSFAWHELSLTLAPDSNYRAVERRMLAAVDAAFRDYHKDLERLRRQMENSLTSVTVGSLEPKARFRLTPAGLEVLIRFPVEASKAAEIDDRVTRELLHAIEQEPPLKIVGAEVPTIRLQTDAAAVATKPA
jgi:small-conductance mechanosensitive channel